MKFLCYLMALVSVLTAKDTPKTFIDCYKAGMIEIQDGKIQLCSNHLAMIQEEMFFLSSTLEWLPVSNTLGEILGVATIEDYREECKARRTCLRQHVGFRWSAKWNLWFCLNECPYNFHTNFPDGKFE